MAVDIAFDFFIGFGGVDSGIFIGICGDNDCSTELAVDLNGDFDGGSDGLCFVIFDPFAGSEQFFDVAALLVYRKRAYLRRRSFPTFLR